MGGGRGRTRTSSAFSATAAASFSATWPSSNRRRCAFFSLSMSLSRHTTHVLRRWRQCEHSRGTNKGTFVAFCQGSRSTTFAPDITSLSSSTSLRQVPQERLVGAATDKGHGPGKAAPEGTGWGRTLTADAGGFVRPDACPLVTLEARLAVHHHRVPPAAAASASGCKLECSHPTWSRTFPETPQCAMTRRTVSMRAMNMMQA